VISAPARFPVVCLPQMNHFMHQRGEDLFIRSTLENIRVQRDLIRFLIASAMPELLGPKVALGALHPLECH